MASAFCRSLILLAFFAFVVALVPTGIDAAGSVKFSVSSEDVVYGECLHILSTRRSQGGVTSEHTVANRTNVQRLTGAANDVGSLFTLESASGAGRGSTVYAGDEVYVKFFKLSRDAPEFWKWDKQGENEFLLKRTYVARTKFKIVALPVPRIYPPVYWYQFQSRPGSYSSGLSGYNENGVTYIRFGDEGSRGDLAVQFQRAPRCPEAITLPTDT